MEKPLFAVQFQGLHGADKGDSYVSHHNRIVGEMLLHLLDEIIGVYAGSLVLITGFIGEFDLS